MFADLDLVRGRVFLVDAYQCAAQALKRVRMGDWMYQIWRVWTHIVLRTDTPGITEIPPCHSPVLRLILKPA